MDNVIALRKGIGMNANDTRHFVTGDKLAGMLDELTRYHVAGVESFGQWIRQEEGTSYRPSLYTSPRSKKARHVLEAFQARVLADAWDDAMRLIGQPARVALRG